MWLDSACLEHGLPKAATTLEAEPSAARMRTAALVASSTCRLCRSTNWVLVIAKPMSDTEPRRQVLINQPTLCQEGRAGFPASVRDGESNNWRLDHRTTPDDMSSAAPEFEGDMQDSRQQSAERVEFAVTACRWCLPARISKLALRSVIEGKSRSSSECIPSHLIPFNHSDPEPPTLSVSSAALRTNPLFIHLSHSKRHIYLHSYSSAAAQSATYSKPKSSRRGSTNHRPHITPSSRFRPLGYNHIACSFLDDLVRTYLHTPHIYHLRKPIDPSTHPACIGSSDTSINCCNTVTFSITNQQTCCCRRRLCAP
ncbi:hypothetical protein PHSY_001322 [Pseudozyma hubeiensis SY62]|uniref:Uncharacterized protein n=1 Tax=Pseudozyma hubeiensis (strain SY62) TaxID=1305764 RepID=R9NYN1_PSEHS|nr:hypothetical protein PHSY_001322 [Pseudozyma hubeiensis SY62]GAC93757.1 hypothetical protein PHSY_001322 [Pseudozyma hubeiensis SY62]